MKLGTFSFYLISVIILLPLLGLVVQSAHVDQETFSFLVSTLMIDTTLNSSVILFVVGFSTLVIGGGCAWCVSYYDFPGRTLCQWLLLMPLAFPPYILAYSYTDFFDQANTLAVLLRSNQMAWLLPDLRTVGGACFILTFCLYPYVYLFARNGFSAVPQSLFDAGKMIQASTREKFFDIALPSSRPYIVVGLMLVTMEVLSDYGTMDYFGIKVFSTIIFDSWAGYGDIGSATRLSLFLLFFILILVWIEKKNRDHMRFDSTKHKETARFLVKGNSVMSLLCFLPIAIGFIAPLFILLSMVITYISWAAVINALPAITNSLVLGGVVAILGVVIGYILAAQKRRDPNGVSHMLFSFCGFGYAIPGIVLGVGMLILSSFFSQAGFLITGSVLFLVMGYLIRFLNIPMKGIESSFEKINPSVDEASQLSQQGRINDLVQIKLPLLLPAMISACLIVTVEVIKELPMTLVLRPFNFDTIAVYTYNLASDERLAEAAFPALCIVLISSLPIIFLNKLSNK